MSVFFEIESMVGPGNGVLQVTKHCVDPAETVHAGAFSLFTNNFSLVDATGSLDSLETPKSVRYYQGRRYERAPGPKLDLFLAETLYGREDSIERMTLFVGLNRRYEGHLVFRTATNFAAGKFAAQIGIINLDPL